MLMINPRLLMRFFYFVFLLSFLNISLMAKDGNDIKIKIANLPDNTACYLAHHYGNKKYIKDTLYVDKKGWINIKTDTTIPGGVYLLVLPSKNYFEFIINESKFSLETDSTDFVRNMSVNGSLENKLFFEYQLFISKLYSEASDIQKQKQNLEKGNDSLKIIDSRLDVINKEVNIYKEKIITENPNTFYSKLLLAMSEPEIPEAPLGEDGKKDQQFIYKEYKKHFFDNIDFSDDRMLRTPIFHGKVMQYMDRLTPKTADSIIASVDIILALSKGNKEVFKYWVSTFLNKYANSKIMGMDAVYVHIAEKYYAGGDASWVKEDLLFKITDNARTLKPLLLGKIAPNLRLRDTTGTYKSIHGISSKFLLVYFWDPDCGHCKKATPKLKKAYDEELKVKGMEVFAICTETEKDKWLKFINENELNWINVADIELQSPFRTLYDIRSTPQLYLLNEKKEIIAKRISVEQLGEVIDNYLGNKSGNIKVADDETQEVE